MKISRSLENLIESFRFDEYANILWGMYNGRFNGIASSKDDSSQVRTTSQETAPPLINTLEAWCPNKVRKCSLGQDK